jgi:hypothetical protein
MNGDGPDIRSFLRGSEEEVEGYVRTLLTSCTEYGMLMMMLVEKYRDELPDEMRYEVEMYARQYYGLLSEFVDVQAVHRAVMGHGREEETDDTPYAG